MIKLEISKIGMTVDKSKAREETINYILPQLDYISTTIDCIRPIKQSCSGIAASIASNFAPIKPQQQ